MPTIKDYTQTGVLLRSGNMLSLDGAANIEWINSNGIKLGPKKLGANTIVGPYSQDVDMIITPLVKTLTYVISAVKDANVIPYSDSASLLADFTAGTLKPGTYSILTSTYTIYVSNNGLFLSGSGTFKTNAAFSAEKLAGTLVAGLYLVLDAGAAYYDGTNINLIGGGMALQVQYAQNNVDYNAGNPYVLAIPANKAGGVMFIDGAGAGGGGGGGWNSATWAAGGGGGASGMSCLQFSVLIPPNVTYCNLYVGKGGSAGIASANVNSAGTNGGAGTETYIEFPEILLAGFAYRALRLAPGLGGGAASSATHAGDGGGLGFPTYLGGSPGYASGTAGPAPATHTYTYDNAGLFLQTSGGSGGPTDNGTGAGDGGAVVMFLASMYNIGGGAKSGQKAGGGAGAPSCFAGLYPAFDGAGGSWLNQGMNGAPYHDASIPGCGGGGGAGNGNGAKGADGILRIYF